MPKAQRVVNKSELKNKGQMPVPNERFGTTAAVTPLTILCNEVEI